MEGCSGLGWVARDGGGTKEIVPFAGTRVGVRCTRERASVAIRGNSRFDDPTSEKRIENVSFRAIDTVCKVV